MLGPRDTRVAKLRDSSPERKQHGRARVCRASEHLGQARILRETRGRALPSRYIYRERSPVKACSERGGHGVLRNRLKQEGRKLAGETAAQVRSPPLTSRLRSPLELSSPQFASPAQLFGLLLRLRTLRLVTRFSRWLAALAGNLWVVWRARGAAERWCGSRAGALGTGLDRCHRQWTRNKRRWKTPTLREMGDSRVGRARPRLWGSSLQP